MSVLEDKKVIVIPCSGIGKVLGSVSREAAYLVIEELRPEETDTVALSLLVLGDEAAKRAVQDHPTITIDGCRYECASKNVTQAGGQVARCFTVLEALRRYRLKPKSIADLGESGELLARRLAEEVVEAVIEIRREEM